MDVGRVANSHHMMLVHPSAVRGRLALWPHLRPIRIWIPTCVANADCHTATDSVLVTAADSASSKRQQSLCVPIRIRIATCAANADCHTATISVLVTAADSASSKRRQSLCVLEAVVLIQSSQKT